MNTSETRIILEPMAYEELPLLVDWLSRESEDFLIRYAGHTFRFPLTLEQLHQHYEKGLNCSEGDVYLYKLVLKASREVIGAVQLCHFDRERYSAYIGRFIIADKANRKKGYGSEALKLLSIMARDEFKLKRLNLKVFKDNLAAIHCYIYNCFVVTSSDKIEYEMSKSL